MASDSSFAKKIEELTLGELEYTEDFFKKTFGDKKDASHFSELKQASSRTPHATISPHITDDDIDDAWLAEQDTAEGQLPIDVFQTNTEIVITTAIAGVRAEDLQIDLHGDMLTLKGKRQPKCRAQSEDQYLARECFWGEFSRSIILPVDVQHNAIEATLEFGVLTIRIPKSQQARSTNIRVIDISSPS